MTPGPRILLVGHDASRTGAPTLGRSWVRWLRSHDAATVSVLLQRGGPLEADLGALAPTTTWGRPRRLLEDAAAAGLVPPAGRRAVLAPAQLLRRARSTDAPIVVANSVAAWATAAEVRPRSRLVCWVHELDGVADRLVGPDRRAALLAQTDHLVAEGDRVAHMLCARWGVDPARISTVDSFIDPPAVVAPPTGHHQVLGIGSLVPRKGADLFASVAAELHRTHPALRGAWVGGDPASAFGALVAADLRAAGLEGIVDVPGAVADVEPWWPAHGVLVHPAREDPAPLVVLEAALRSIPVVAWSGSSTGDLLVQAGCGHLAVEPGDVLALARATRRLLDEPDAHRAAGEALHRATRHRTTEVQGPRLLDAVVGTTS